MPDRTKQPPIKQIEKISWINPELILRERNLEFYGLPSQKDPIVKVEFVLPAGRFLADNVLVPLMVSRLFGRATKKHTSDEISDLMDFYGISYKVGVFDDYTSVSFYAISKFASNLLDLIIEIFEDNSFDEDEFKVELEREKSAFSVNLQKTDFLARREFMKRLYGEENYKLIDFKDFENITVGDLENFTSNYFSFIGAIVIVSGDYNENDVKTLANFIKNYANYKKIPENRQPLTIQNQSKYYCVEKENAEQSTVITGKITIDKKHEDYKKLAIVNTVLGGYFGSRLSKNIREDKGFTYGVYSILSARRTHSIFKIEADIGVEHKDAYLKEVRSELNKICEAPVGNGELTLVKNYLSGSLLGSFDGVFEQAAIFASLRRNGLDFSYYDDFLAELKTVTANELKSVANKYLKFDEMINVIAGKC